MPGKARRPLSRPRSPRAPRRPPAHRREGVVYDWNEREPWVRPTQRFTLFDETLRDGLQSPSITDPPLAAKLELLELMEQNGIESADLGVPAASRRAFEDVVAMCRHLRKRRMKLEPACAARTVIEDIQAVAEVSQRSGQRLLLYTFIGSSPIRRWAEQWDTRFLLQTSIKAIDFAVKEGLEVAFVTEDTVRTPPHDLDTLFRAALEHGATRLVLCDTAGHATPGGARALVRWTRALVEGLGSGAGAKVRLDWHGHNDRGLGVVNALAALEAGAHRLHGCGLGIGERVGNTSLDLLLVNLKLLGWIDRDLTQLVPYVRKVSEATRFPIPSNYPLSGEDAFRTATGVHAAALAKAQRRGDPWLADRLYSAVAAAEFGRTQQIDVGFMSGMSNVRYWLELRGLPATEPLCQEILARAKARSWTLTDAEILEVVIAHGVRVPGQRPPPDPRRRRRG